MAQVASLFLSNVQIPMTVPNCGLIRMTGGVKRLVDESMEEEGCRGTVGREIVEDKESEGV